MPGLLIFLISITDMDKDVSESKLISFAVDTRIYTKIQDVTDYNPLQQNRNHVYDWDATINMYTYI